MGRPAPVSIDIDRIARRVRFKKVTFEILMTEEEFELCENLDLKLIGPDGRIVEDCVIHDSVEDVKYDFNAKKFLPA